MYQQQFNLKYAIFLFYTTGLSENVAERTVATASGGLWRYEQGVGAATASSTPQI